MANQDLVIEKDCVIAGGGPAGMVLGYLLARAGLKVSVLEKHEDFLRDFRGDTIHPSTIGLLRELGIVDRFLELPLSRVTTMDAVIDGSRFTLADFSMLKKPENFLVFAPQWDFLNFLAAEGEKLEGFDLQMSTTATDLIVESGKVVGVRASNARGLTTQIRATLTVAADGRSSVLREKAGLTPVDSGAPIDVLWFHLPKPQDPPPATLGYISTKGMVLTLDRGDYYQAGMVIPKGHFEQVRAQGIQAFRAGIVAAVPHLAEAVHTLRSWDQIKLLSVQINHLERWSRPGFIAIGDAAHAMSPMFGVGVNYAIQDAVALSNAISQELVQGRALEEILEVVQKRRERPVKKMQRLQQFGHRGIARVTSAKGDRVAPRPLVGLLRLFSPLIRRFMPRFIGYGFLPEHYRPDAQ